MNIILWIIFSSLLIALLLRSLLHLSIYLIFLIIIILIGYGCSYLLLFYFNHIIQRVLRHLGIKTNRKAILVTGCDSGFGLLTSIHLQKLGFTVFSCVLSTESNGALILNSTTHVIKMDVTKEDEINSTFEYVRQKVIEENLQLWAIINNAGIGQLQLMEFCSVEILEKMFNVNTLGMFRVSQKFLPLIRESMKEKWPRIVNVTSIAGILYAPFMGAYTMSKFGAEAISNTLASELLDVGIRVVAIRPGLYKTALTAEKVVDMDGGIALYGSKYMSEAAIKLRHIFNVKTNENVHEVIETVEKAVCSIYPLDIYYTNNETEFLVDLRKCLGEWFMKRWGLREFLGDTVMKSS